MTIRELALDILGRIRDSAAVQSWCEDRYQKPITLFLGIGGIPDANPQAQDLPLAIVTEGEITYGSGGKAQSAVVVLGWEVSGEGSTEVNGIREVAGAVDSEALGGLIVAAVNVVTREYSVTSVEMAPAITGEWAPRFPGVMTISMQLR